MTRITVAFVGLAAVGAANAQVIDGGNFDAEYGSALFSQTVGTQFGNNDDPSADLANGSEIDNTFASLSGGSLFAGVGGNLETNFNHVLLFVDFQDGGQNTLSDTNPDINFNNLNNNAAGLTFDPSFGADYVIDYTNGVGGSGEVEHFLNVAALFSDGTGAGGFAGGGIKADVPVITGDGGSGGSVSITSDQSNTLGVGSFGNPNDSDPATVFTGIEFSLDLLALGWDGATPVKIAGFVTSGNFDFTSNQVIGGLPEGTENLAFTGDVNFAEIDGEQFVVIPAPATSILALGGGLALIRRRR